MADFTFPPVWSEALDALTLSTSTHTTPGGEQEEWAQALTCFATRGFMMGFVRPQAQGIALRLDLALPDTARTAPFAREVAARLRVLGARDAQVLADGPPAIIKAGFGEQDAERAHTVLTLLLKLGDYIRALEQNPSAPSPLEHMDAPAGQQEVPGGETTFSGFEAIGSKAKDTQEESKESKETSRERPPAGFERIGKKVEAEQPERERTGAQRDATRVVAADVWLARDEVHVAVALDARGGQAQIEHALAHVLRTRFDARANPAAQVEPSLRGNHASLLTFALAPALTTASAQDVRQLREDLQAYFERLVRFGELDIKLGDVLDLSERAEQPPRTTRQPARGDETTRRESSPREAPRRERAGREEDESGFVFDLGGAASEKGQASQSPSGADTLRTGDFEDARLAREDAETSLVDVVLRHPGYSDKNICQVLTILLTIEYSKALETIAKAPCVLAWGIGMERAQTFKNVIEGAGGKVLLVEPGTFSSN